MVSGRQTIMYSRCLFSGRAQRIGGMSKCSTDTIGSCIQKRSLNRYVDFIIGFIKSHLIEYTLKLNSETRVTLGVGPDLVSAAAEELGHEPRHHLMVEALSTLAREDVWQKPTRDSDRILEMWDHAMGWCVEVMSSEPSLASPLHYL